MVTNYFRVGFVLALLAGLGAEAQGQPRMLPTYRGWGLGISLDSANKLAVRDTKFTLVCVADETRELLCQFDEQAKSRFAVTARFSPAPRRLKYFALTEMLSKPVAADSIIALFSNLWGQPARLPPAKDTAVLHSQTIGEIALWSFPAAEASVLTVHFGLEFGVMVQIANRGFSARELEQLRLRARYPDQRVIIH